MAKRELTPEQKERARANLAAAREAKMAKMAAADEGALAAPAAVDEPEVAEPVESVAAERRRRLLADLPAEIAALVSDDELAAIEAEETQKALAEQKKQALSDVRSMARQYARIEHDLIPSDVLRSEEERKRLAEPVRIRVNLPEGGGAQGFRIDGRLLRQGMEYTVSRAVFESLQSTFYRMHLSEVEFSTLDQQKRGNTAREVLSRRRPSLEVMNG